MRWRVLGALGAVVLIAVGLGAIRPAPAAAVTCAPSGTGGAPSAIDGGFHGVTPRRLLDTRGGPPSTLGPVPPGCTVAVDVTTGAVPASATAVALNVTTTDAQGPGFLTAWPCGSARPGTSNLNTRTVTPTPNLVLVPLDGTRLVCFWANVRLQLILDLTGWFGTGGEAFHEQSPTRALDTRSGPRPAGTSGPLAANVPFRLPLTGDFLPLGATGAAVNVTATGATAAGFVLAYPCGTSPPLASTVNFLPGEDRANQTMVVLGGGAICLLSSVTVHVVVDVNGWFGTGPGAIDLGARSGERIVDSRNGIGWSGRIAAGGTQSFASPAAGARMVVVNVVATQALGAGYLTLYPCGGALPPTSSVNYSPAGDATNLVTVPVGDDGRVCVFSFAPTHVVIDLAGTFGADGAMRSLSVGPIELSPPFDADVHDYAVRCTAATNQLRIQAKAMPGSNASVGNGAGAPAVDVQVNVAVDDAVVVRAGADQYWVRCLPNDFPRFTVASSRGRPEAWYLTTITFGSNPSYVMILDNRGTPVWYRKTATPVIDLRRLPSGNLAWMQFARGIFNDLPAVGYEEHALNGNLIRTIRSGGGLVTDYHDLLALPNGNFMTLSFVVRPRVNPNQPPFTCNEDVQIDNVIHEVTPAGAVVWEWDSRDHVLPRETLSALCDQPPANGVRPTGGLDMLHVNGFSLAPDGSGDLIVSARQLDAVLRIRHAPGAGNDKDTLWKLGGNAPASQATVHYTMVGDPLGSFQRQHDARMLPNGHITVHDNHTDGNAAPRALEIALDPATGTASIVRQVPYPDPGARSGVVGSTRQDAAGSWLVTWGGQSAPGFTEVAADGTVVMQGSFAAGAFPYRVVKEPLASFNVQQLRNTAGGGP